MIMKERQSVEELGGKIRYSTDLHSASNIAKKTFSKLRRSSGIFSDTEKIQN